MKFQSFIYVCNLSINIYKFGLHTSKWSLASILPLGKETPEAAGLRPHAANTQK